MKAAFKSQRRNNYNIHVYNNLILSRLLFVPAIEHTLNLMIQVTQLENKHTKNQTKPKQKKKNKGQMLNSKFPDNTDNLEHLF